MWFILGAVLILFFVMGATLVQAAGVDEKLKALIRKWAGTNNLDPALVYGVVMKESSGNPDARNLSDPSAGLMGIMPIIGRAYGDLEGDDLAVLVALRDPETNMKAGTGFLAHLQARYSQRFPLAVWIGAYNLGETKFDRGTRAPAYSARVMKFSAQWEA